MKSILLLALGMAFAVQSHAQAADTSRGRKGPKQVDSMQYYCAVMMGSKMVIQSADSKNITVDTKLQNGGTLTPSGEIIQKDGTKRTLTNGECIDLKGNTPDHTNNKK